MAIRIAINGYGRIGRNILRALYEGQHRHDIEVIAINDLGNSEANAHLTQYDSVHGRFPHQVRAESDRIFIDTDEILTFAEKDPEHLNWDALDIDIVFECTGRFTSREAASVHLAQGAKQVLISAPAKGVDATIVYGVNHHQLKASDQIVSNASCTTNCLAPLAKVLHDTVGIQSGIMTTIHAYTNDQHLTDLYTDDIYRARSATLSMIPTRTGAAEAVGLVLPELDGKLSGLAVRVPTANVSLVDLSFTPVTTPTVEEINAAMQAASETQLKGILECNSLPLVSIDFNHHPASCIFDTQLTRVEEGLVKAFAWYDNEWGFSNRMLDTALAMRRAS